MKGNSQAVGAWWRAKKHKDMVRRHHELLEQFLLKPEIQNGAYTGTFTSVNRPKVERNSFNRAQPHPLP